MRTPRVHRAAGVSYAGQINGVVAQLSRYAAALDSQNMIDRILHDDCVHNVLWGSYYVGDSADTVSLRYFCLGCDSVDVSEADLLRFIASANENTTVD